MMGSEFEAAAVFSKCIRPRIPAVANAADFAETQVPWGEWSLAARKCGDVVTVARMVRATADYRRGASRASQ